MFSVESVNISHITYHRNDLQMYDKSNVEFTVPAPGSNHHTCVHQTA